MAFMDPRNHKLHEYCSIHFSCPDGDLVSNICTDQSEEVDLVNGLNPGVSVVRIV